MGEGFYFPREGKEKEPEDLFFKKLVLSFLIAEPDRTLYNWSWENFFLLIGGRLLDVIKTRR